MSSPAKVAVGCWRFSFRPSAAASSPRQNATGSCIFETSRMPCGQERATAALKSLSQAASLRVADLTLLRKFRLQCKVIYRLRAAHLNASSTANASDDTWKLHVAPTCVYQPGGVKMRWFWLRLCRSQLFQVLRVRPQTVKEDHSPSTTQETSQEQASGSQDHESTMRTKLRFREAGVSRKSRSFRRTK